MRAVVATKKQINIPIPAGTAKEMAVHFRLFVSFPMVIQVVEQGQCISENKMVHTAVNHVQPLSTKSACNCVRSLISMRLPVAMYVIIIMGTTISLAGNPRINANRITPSSPRSCAKGSRKAAQYANKLALPYGMFASNQISNPAGAATTAALPKTNKVRSKIERTITFPVCGRRYGGSSNVNEEGMPFRIVADSKRETKKVIPIPNTITPIRSRVESTEPPIPAVPIKNMEMIAIIVGNAPPDKRQTFAKQRMECVL